MANSLRERILPPYVQRADDLQHRTLKILLVLTLIGFSMFLGFWLAIFGMLFVQPFVVVLGILLMLAFWMLPDSNIDMEPRIKAWFMWFLGTLMIWPQYLAVELPGLPWITPTRLLLAGMALFFMLQVSQSKDTRGLLKNSMVSVTPAYQFFLLFWLITFLTSPMAKSLATAFSMAAMQMVLWCVPMLVTLYLFRNKQTTQRFFVMMLIAAAVLFVLTTLEYRAKYPIWAPHIPSFLTVDGPTLNNLLNGQMRVGEDRYRAKGNYGVHLYYTQFILLVAPFIIHWMFSATSKNRPWAIALFVYLWVDIWFTNTRTGTTGLIVLTVAYGLLYGFRRFLKPQSQADMAAPAALVGAPVAAMGVFIAIMASPRLQTMTLGGHQHASSDVGRDLQWEKAIAALQNNPLGHGAGSAGELAGRLDGHGTWIIDSMWINFLLDYGILGALSFLCFLLAIMYYGVKAYLSQHDEVSDLAGPAVVALFGFMLTMYTISFSGNFSMMLMIVALIVSITYRLKTETKLNLKAPK